MGTEHDDMDETAERDAAARARVGTSLRSKWHLDALLGIGGMAAVYAATHRNGRRGAVKILHSGFGDEDMRRRFLREGRIANRVQHDGVVGIIDDDVSDDGNPFLVMELLEGETVSARAARTHDKLSTDVVLVLVDQVLDALAAAHDKGILHRDIKPENLFITTGERVKLLDFGIARLADPLEAHFAVTQLGTTMGTPAFMAPEQARGRCDLVGPQSDLWSVGATMFTLLTGDFVHRGTSLNELLAVIITEPARSLAVALPGAPTPVVAIVDRALQLDKADRWQDAREMQAAVRAAYRAVTGVEMPRVQTSTAGVSSEREVARAAVSPSAAPNARRSPMPSIPSATKRAPPVMGRPLRRNAIATALLAMALGASGFATVRLSRAATTATARTFELSQRFEPSSSNAPNVDDSSTTPTSHVAAAQPSAQPIGPKVDLRATAKTPSIKLTSVMTTTSMARTGATPRTTTRAATPIEGSVARPERDTKSLLDRRL